MRTSRSGGHRKSVPGVESRKRKRFGVPGQSRILVRFDDWVLKVTERGIKVVQVPFRRGAYIPGSPWSFFGLIGVISWIAILGQVKGRSTKSHEPTRTRYQPECSFRNWSLPFVGFTQDVEFDGRIDRSFANRPRRHHFSMLSFCVFNNLQTAKQLHCIRCEVSNETKC